MAPDKYQTPPQAPPVFKATADSILADAKKITDSHKALLDKVVADTPVEKATFSTVMDPILKDENVFSCVTNALTFYQHVSPDKALREASTKAEEQIQEFGIETQMRDDVFKLVDAAFETRESQNLDKESLRILEKERKKYIQKGLLLPPGPQRDRFKETQKRISQLCIQGQKNLNEENGAMWFTKEELDGVPPDDLDVETLEKGTGENDGKYKVTFKYNHFFPLVKYAVNEDVRREYMISDSNKANINVPLFKEILELRDEAARILGYPNHASLKIDNKMAKTETRVNEFLGDLRTRLAAGGKKELDDLRQYKKRDCEERGVSFDGNFYMWDSSLYSRKMKEQEYSLDEVKISQYFPVDSTFAAMLKIFEEIFGFVFVELKEEERARLSPTGKAGDIVWHDEVRLFSVWDDDSNGNGFCGYLYIDLHPRDNKYSHNANFNLEPGFITKDGTRHYPATALVCNFSKASPTKPALLKHHEVVTLFHELGHGIHDLSGRTKYSYFHGTSVVADFVEAPSQMLENWCWTPSVLKNLSKHWETNEQIPDDLVANLVRTRHFGSATFTLNQLLIGIFDMTAHSPLSHNEAKAMNFGKLYNQLRHDINPSKGPEDIGRGMEWGNRYAGIGHFIGGYDAGYYGYLWSEVFSTDMFHTRFKQNPMHAEQGRKYRKIILERGGSIDETESLTEFLGRPPSTEQFYKELGLA